MDTVTLRPDDGGDGFERFSCMPRSVDERICAHGGSPKKFSHNEIKPPKSALVRATNAHDQSPVKQTISVVQALAREVQLGRKYAAMGLLDLDMIVAGSTGVCRRHNGGKPPATIIIGVLIAPQFVTFGVIGP
jgi:hypothetical protein